MCRHGGSGKGYDSDDDTWEPLVSLGNSESAITAYERAAKQAKTGAGAGAAGGAAGEAGAGKGKRIFQCPECKKTFKSKDGHKYHMAHMPCKRKCVTFGDSSEEEKEEEAENKQKNGIGCGDSDVEPDALAGGGSAKR